MTETMEIFWEFKFEAAHRLPNVPTEHKCSRLHGHSYKVQVHVKGPIEAQSGWVVDFGNIKDACKPVIDRLDHYYLNEIPGLENPTSELLARWIWQRIAPSLPLLARVALHETCESRCEYAGD